MDDFLSQNISYLSTRPGFSEKEAERATGIGQPAINKIARGRTQEAGYRTVAKLAAFYGVSVDDLIHRDLAKSGGALSQPAGLDHATMAQGVELLYLLADARPEDKRLERPTWAMIQVAAKAVSRAEGSPREAMAEILAELSKEM